MVWGSTFPRALEASAAHVLQLLGLSSVTCYVDMLAGVLALRCTVCVCWMRALRCIVRVLVVVGLALYCVDCQ